MADINNFTEIAENFDTIKTLLNSIRAQGILNTSDVDKLLAGINSKLEKLNTEEDIDLIKIFLSELKQNLDERHGVLLSKFGAIESLFSNLLKNSSETLKSSEVKELFDIVATNLSVFSREVVSQKETLNDISLRLETMRSDDSQKKEIVKNITFLKNDIERLTNGFDSIVLSLNENFKTLIKTISSIDPTDKINEFGKELQDIVNSSNTILSALQVLDKKNTQIEENLKTLATQEDLVSTKKWISDLASQDQLLAQSIDNLADKYYKIDNLAEKIDASVEIIAGLKTIIANKDEQSSAALIDKLNHLEAAVINMKSDEDFESFKHQMENALNDIYESVAILPSAFEESKQDMQKINETIKALDINLKFKAVSSDINKSEQILKEHINVETDKVIQLIDVNSTRALNELSSSADIIGEKLGQTQSLLSTLCEKSFADVEESLSSLRTIVSQIDENNVSANNAIFSNITDRLALFENSLKSSLEKQEDYVANSSAKLLEQINNLKDSSGILDYKLDSSVIEINNAKLEFDGLKKAVNELLALDFVNKVSDLKVDLYAAKKELSAAIETSASSFSEKFTSDLFGKYELLISKLDSVEEEIKQTQSEALGNIKAALDNISSSIVDVLSYVSTTHELNSEVLENKLDNVAKIISDNNLSYIENVRDIVDVVRVQVENNLKALQEDTTKRISSVNSLFDSKSEVIREDISNSYKKLIEVQERFDDLKEALNLSNTSVNENINNIVSTATTLKDYFDGKLSGLKGAILDKVTDFQKEFTCENADKISEIKFASEALLNKSLQVTEDTKNELKGEFAKLIGAIKLNIEEFSEQLAAASVKIESSTDDIVNCVRNDFNEKLDSSINELNTGIHEFSKEIDDKSENIVAKVNVLEQSVSNLANSTTNTLASTLAKILDNFVALKTLIGNLNDKTANDLQKSAERIISDFETLRDKVDIVDSNIDEDMTRQLSIIETNFENLNKNIAGFFEQTNNVISNTLNSGLMQVSKVLNNTVYSNLEGYKKQVEDLFNKFALKNSEQVNMVEAKVLELNSILQQTINEQNDNAAAKLDEVTTNLKKVLEDNLELSSSDYNSLKESLNKFAEGLEVQNSSLSEHLKTKLSDIAKFIDSGLTTQSQAINEKFEDIIQEVAEVASAASGLNNEITHRVSKISTDINALKTDLYATFGENAGLITNKIESLLSEISSGFSKILSNVQKTATDTRDGINEKIGNEIRNSTEILNSNLIDLKNDIADYSNIQKDNLVEQIGSIQNDIKLLNKDVNERISILENAFSGNITEELNSLYERVNSLLEQHSISLSALNNNNSSRITEELDLKVLELKASFENLNERLDKDEVSRMNVFQSQLKELSNTFNKLIEETRNTTKNEISSIAATLVATSREAFTDVETSIDNKVNSVLAASADIAAQELQSMEIFANKILSQVNICNDTVNSCRNFITDFVKNEVEALSDNIEKETDVIIKELIDQTGGLRDFQKDELVKLTSQLEAYVEDCIYNNINELKSHFDIKTDTTVLNSKIDNINLELNRTAEDILAASNKLLEASVFENAIADMKSANQVLISSMAASLNEKFQQFIKENISQNISEKFELFDNKLVELVVNKYEEIKQLSLGYNKTFVGVQSSIGELISKFNESKEEIYKTILSVLSNINDDIDELNLSFTDLQAQLISKFSNEELNNQVKSIQALVNQQIGYLEDISELCCNNLPELTEINALVKYNIIESLSNLNSKINEQEVNVQNELISLKTDIITQFLNVFNQISFVTEQEEILDFIQNKHSELISILSHIVNTVEDIDCIKDQLEDVDNKVDAVKSNLGSINEKISAIISSNGDVDYVYSLQDLESDIAHFRMTLNELKEKNNSKELEDLISSTNGIYELVDSIKSELPHFNAEEFKKDFEALSEDIVSISTRTNKLILASDESYKTLQENLQDFKLVINDLDERTRNFAHEAGLDRIDNKLGIINSMMQSGAKTNQVFNQVFEYLAEWVDNAGAQITSISDKVETLDEIGQIKVMLEDLKAEAEDDSESTELIEALSNVFEKQAKKISSLEAKLDRVIVETTINNKNSKIDLTPFEETLNRFLVAIDDKMMSQQAKIDSLESKLEDVMSMINPKDTAQLTKKVGGMDRQIAKLNKSIEKIASHVVEK